MSHHLTTLAYDMNYNSFRHAKWLKGIEFVARYSELGSGYGGYNEDDEFFGRHQTI